MELAKKDVFKIETLTVAEYSQKYGGGVSSQALSYAMENDKIDYVKVGKERLIVMTERTKLYVPNTHPARGEGKKTRMAV